MSRKASPVARMPGQVRQTLSFDADWRFLKSDADGAQQGNYNDASWRVVTVPHDWSIEGPFDRNAATSGSGGFLPAGVGWYRKHFILPAADAGKRVFVDFDGVMANSEVWINGVSLGQRPSGYVSFRYELTGHLMFGSAAGNVIAVRADNSLQPASRWYSGAGIYRHVRLVVTEPVHLGQWATFVTTPVVTAARAVVHVESGVVNQGTIARTVALQFSLLAPDGRLVGSRTTQPQSVTAGGQASFAQDIPVSAPRLWDIRHPVLYHVVTRVLAGSVTLDNETEPLGIREFHFDAATGFWLNGRNFKLKGVCLHGDAGGLGTAVPLGVWQRRLTKLRALGVNAIRTSHNPSAPEFLDLCDRMGFLVMDEFFDAWTVAKRPGDYHLFFRQWGTVDAHDTIMRDRNHPSIILYSVGNEIHDTSNAARSKEILASLLTACHAADPTRPVTLALLHPLRTHDYENGLADMLDVLGTNYHEQNLLGAHATKPSRKILGTENQHNQDAWVALRDNPPYAGQFLWTGVDYLGESRGWPRIGAPYGLIDRTNWPRARAFQRQSWWSGTPMVSIARVSFAMPQPRLRPNPAAPSAVPRPEISNDWTPRDRTPHMENVEVYSNCEQVELFLNGKTLGSLPLPADASPRRWHIAFAPGTLKAVARNQGHVVAMQALKTAGPPARLLLTADQTTLPNDWDDVSYVRAVVVDAGGVPVPSANSVIHFQVAGPGSLAAVDNGDADSHEPFQALNIHAFQGHCVAILKAAASTGVIAVTASSPGLASSSVLLHATSPSSVKQGR